MMGWAMNNRCYSTPEDAHSAFRAGFPLVDASGITKWDTSTLNVIGVAPRQSATISYTLKVRSWADSTDIEAQKAGVFPLMQCPFDAGDQFSNIAIQDIAVAIGMGLCFVIGIVAGKMR